ncbi:hypothetical protein F5Y12DRAFT_731925 [Xylaria sp. FL1777]|nr:hypothetical protein F5Y12DRAFT_731925 [Xylaria sp. FL1777]
MGWMWSSGAAPKGSTIDTLPTPTATTTAENQSIPSRTPEPISSDPEIAKFLAQLQAEFGSSNNSATNTSKPAVAESKAASPSPSSVSQPPPSSSSSSSSSSWWPSWSQTSQQPSPSFQSLPQQSQSPASPPTETPRLDPLSESLLPTSMSCRQAFDHAFHCNSVGGQWTSVYRSGGMRSCSEQWDDFWFCMRTRAYSGAVKEEAIREHYRRRELARYGPGMPSSTDVWEARVERLAPGDAFRGGYRRPDISDEEWRRLEIERRRMIQRRLREEEEEEESRRRTASS